VHNAPRPGNATLIDAGTGLPAPNQAVKAAAVVKINVFTKCNEMTTARAPEASSATSSASTQPAPISASKITNNSVKVALQRVRRFCLRSTHAQTTSAIAIGPRIPLVTRWPYSIHVLVDSVRGMTSPLQVGQWSPQPAPDPVM